MKRDHGGRARQYICCGIEAQDYFGAILAHRLHMQCSQSVSQENGRGGGVLVKRMEGEEVC